MGTSSKKRGGIKEKLKAIKDTVTKFFKSLIDAAISFYQTIVAKVRGIKLRDTKKTYTVETKYQEFEKWCRETDTKLQKCKNLDDIKKVMENFRKRKVAIFAGAVTATITLTAAISYLVNRSAKVKGDLRKREESVQRQLREAEERASIHTGKIPSYLTEAGSKKGSKKPKESPVFREARLKEQERAIEELKKTVDEQFEIAKAKSNMEITAQLMKSEQEFSAKLAQMLDDGREHGERIINSIKERRGESEA